MTTHDEKRQNDNGWVADGHLINDLIESGLSLDDFAEHLMAESVEIHKASEIDGGTLRDLLVEGLTKWLETDNNEDSERRESALRLLGREAPETYRDLVDQPVDDRYTRRVTIQTDGEEYLNGRNWSEMTLAEQDAHNEWVHRLHRAHVRVAGLTPELRAAVDAEISGEEPNAPATLWAALRTVLADREAA